MQNTDNRKPYELRSIGIVRSSLTTREDCPHQGREGAPNAWLEMDPAFADGLAGLTVGMEVVLLTWLHQARRDVLQVHPRGNPKNPRRGVFATRSPDRPNPLGLHCVKILKIEGNRIKSGPLEVLDNTPIIDIKPAFANSRA